MPPLKDARREIYCQFVSNGETGKDSAVMAGFKAGKNEASAACQSTKLRKLPEIQTRIKELQISMCKKIQKRIMSAVERRVRLSEFAGANLIDFVDEDGDVVINKNQKGVGALSEYTVKTRYLPGDDAGIERTKTIKLRDPIASIDLLNKMDKVYSEAPVTNDNRRFLIINVVDNEAKDLIAQVKARTQKLIEG